METPNANNEPMTADVKALTYPGWIPGGGPPSMLVSWEIGIAKEDGRDSEALTELEKAAETASEAELIDIYRQIIDLPVSKDFPYQEPDDLASIQALRPSADVRKFEVNTNEDFLYERLYGAWLGRSAGCTLGVPGEFFRPATRERLKKFLTAISPDEWPIHDYTPMESPSDLKFPERKRQACRGHITYAPQDDDLTHTVIVQLALSELDNPLDLESQDLARTWYQYLTYRLTEGGCAMEAFRNLTIRYPMRKIGKYPRGEDPIDWHWVATHSNPFRENIDASLRADSYGYAAPGHPELAAELAWRDARMSNVKNGTYCALLYAAMISAAFVMDDPERIIWTGLAEIPETSRLYEAAVKTLDICSHYRSQPINIDDVHDELYDVFGDNDRGIINNMAVVLSSLVLGGDDLEKVITYAVMGGWDCDCTGASAGSIVGTMVGASRLPEKWVAPFNDTLYAGVYGYHPIKISECARRSVAIASKVLKHIAG